MTFCQRSLLLLGLWLPACSSTPPFSAGSFPKEGVQLKVNGPVDLDGKPVSDVHKLRDEAIKAEPLLKGLVPSGYKAASSVLLSSVDDGLPWLGLEGWACSTPENFATNFSDGDSIASVVIGNPFVLVSLKSAFVEMACYKVWDDQAKEFAMSELVPSEVSLDGPARKVLCKYQWHGIPPTRIHMAQEPERPEYLLNTANAKDLGLNFCKVVGARSEGVTVSEMDKLRETNQRYNGTHLQGHNKVKVNDQIIATAAFTTVRFDRLPVKLTVELYRESPSDPQAAPDVTEEILVAGQR